MNKHAENTSVPRALLGEASDGLLTGPKTSGFGTILQVVPALGSGGGVERGTVEITEAIVEAGGRALVVSAGGPQVHEIKRAGGKHIELPVHSKNPLVMYNNIQRLIDLIKLENIDLVHARSRAPAWSSFYATRRAKCPLITTFHGTYNAGTSLKRTYNKIMTKGVRVIAISNYIGEHVRRLYGVPATRLRIIHRGVDIKRFSPDNVSAERIVQLANAWRLTDGYPVVMLPGRLTRWKGQTVFIDAISKLNRRDIRCLIVGSDQGRIEYRQRLETMVKQLDLGEVVRIVDHCADMPAAYMLSDVVVSASTDPEAFGRVIIEAQALGRPVVASDHGGARETVLPKETGWLVPPGDSNALASTLQEVLQLDAESRAILSEAAIGNVSENFSKQRMCSRTLSVYNEVLQVTKTE